MSMRGGYVTQRWVDHWREQVANGVSVEELAERSGFSVATIKKYLKGKNPR